MSKCLTAAAILSLFACATTPATNTPEPAASPARAAVADLRGRAIRRDLRMMPAIRRAHAAGTRDSTGRPGARYWQQAVDYVIEASLDVATSEIRGRETITLSNSSPDTLSQIVLRLYQNYYTPTAERSAYVTGLTQGMKIERLAVGGRDIALSDAKQYRVDETIATITPPSPVLPGASVRLDVTWRFAVSLVDTAIRGQRMGRYGNRVYQVAQWYPQIAMYDDMRGWDTDPYLGNGEFYNQYGSFDVKITAPGGWLVGATGDLQNAGQVLSKRTRDRLALAMGTDTTVLVVKSEERGSGATAPGRALTWHFKAPLVNDFAFAASRDYLYDAAHATIPGKGRIPIHVFYLPEHTLYRTLNTAQFAREALESLSSWLFPYEFSQATIADGPETGMEYPMIIFNGSSRGVTTHELAHQWFPMMVGSNETRHGFMDEGFGEFLESIAIGEITKKPIDLQDRSPGYRRIAGTELEAPMMWPTLYAGPGGGVATYSKAKIALNALGAVVGDAEVRRAVAEYAAAWKYKHPSPYDFFFSMNRSLGRDLDWFWDAWFFTTHTFDQKISDVTVAGDSVRITITDESDMAMPAIVRIDFTTGFTVVNLPAEIWFKGDRSRTFTLPLNGKMIQSVSLDPENRFQDLDTSNNTWKNLRPAAAYR